MNPFARLIGPLQAAQSVTQLALASTSRRALALLIPDPLQPIRTLEWLLACLYPTPKRRA